MKKNKKLIIILMVIVIIIIACLACVLFLLTDIFKSDEVLFYKYLGKNGEIIQEYYKDINNEVIENVKQDKYETNGTVSFDLVSNDDDIANQSIPARNFTIEYNVQADPQQAKDSRQFNLKYIDKSLFELKYAHNNDSYGITSEEVINKYLKFDNNNLKELAQKYGVEDVSNIPDKIEFKNFSELFTIDEAQLDYIIQTYVPIIKSQLSEDAYYSNKKVMKEINGEIVQTNCYGVFISNEQVQNIIIAVLEKLQEDEQTLNVILNKIMLVDSNSSMTIRTLQENIAEIISETQTSDFSSVNGFSIELFESNGKLVQTQIKTEDEKIYTLSFKNDDNSVSMALDYEYISSSSDTDSFEFKNMELTKQTTNGKTDIMCIITVEGNDLETDDRSIYKISFLNSTVQDAESAKITSNKTINISDSNTTYFSIKLDSVTTPSPNVQVEELTSENSASINNFTPEYAMDLLQKIGDRLEKLFQQKLEIINATEQNDSSQVLEQNEENSIRE